MNFLQATASCFINYAKFSGRAARSEYWYWALFVGLGRLATRILDTVIFHYPIDNLLALHPLSGTFALIVSLPSLAVAVRRLHDVDRSGWWLLMYLTIIGILYPLLVWKFRQGTEGDNRFGPDPLQMGARVANVFS
jgi:uncharacterized membrane protein YhaH (DUF805 family)